MPRKPVEEELDLIGNTCRLAVVAIEQRHLADQLAYQARHDTLTGLPNRVVFEERLEAAVAEARAATARWRCCSSTWTGSSRSTTRWVTRWAM